MMKSKLVLFLLICCLLGLATQAQAVEPKKIVFASGSFKPNCDPSLPQQGFHTDVVRNAFKKAGYEIEVEFMPLMRAIESATAGKHDGILSTFFNKGIADKVVYSIPVVKKRTYFWQRKGASIPYDKLEDLKPYTIGITRGGYFTEEFAKAQKEYLKVEEADGHETNIKKLLAGRIDLILATDSVLYDPELKNQIEPLKKPFSESSIFLAISKKRADVDQVAVDFNRGLKMIMEDGTYEKILTSHSAGDYSAK